MGSHLFFEFPGTTLLVEIHNLMDARSAVAARQSADVEE